MLSREFNPPRFFVMSLLCWMGFWIMVPTANAVEIAHWPGMYNMLTTNPDPKPDYKCGDVKFDEKDAITCILNVVDGNVAGKPGKGDKNITPDEIHMALNSYLPWYIRWWVTTERVMTDCSGSPTGPITAKTFAIRRKEKKCLPTQGNLCQLKGICDQAALDLKIFVY